MDRVGDGGIMFTCTVTLVLVVQVMRGASREPLKLSLLMILLKDLPSRAVSGVLALA